MVNGIEPLLTVVVPTLNSATTLDWTLTSLAAVKKIRVIVADSFSTDGTLEICKRWSVETINVPAGNMYRAINAGMRLATSNWVTYVNSDDCVFPDIYARMLGDASRSNASFVYGSTDFVDANGRFMYSYQAAPGKSAAVILRRGTMPFSQPSAIFRKSAYDRLNGFDERYRSVSDFDFFCRAALAGLPFLRFIGPPVVAFRVQMGLGASHPDWVRDEMATIHKRLELRRDFGGSWARFLWSMSNNRRYLGRILRSPDLFLRYSFQRSTAVPPEILVPGIQTRQ